MAFKVMSLDEITWGVQIKERGLGVQPLVYSKEWCMCSEIGELRRRASEVEKKQERVGSWKPSEECSRKGGIRSLKVLLTE